MRRRICNLAVIVFCACYCPAQTILPRFPSSYAVLGTYSKHVTNVFSFTSNQAALGVHQDAGAGLYAERRYLLDELNFYSLVFCLPMATGGLGFQCDYFGFDEYNQSRLGIAYGKKLGEKVSVGIQFNYHLLHISGYGNAHAVNAEAGILLYPAEKACVGLHVYNLFGGELGRNLHEKLASVYSFGLGYEISEQVYGSIEISKEEDRPVNVHAGLHYVFAGHFFAGIGIESQTSSPYGGAGWGWKNWRLEISTGYHPRLGFSPGLQIMINMESESGDAVSGDKPGTE